MYIDKENRVVILYPHKTGTTTIRTILLNDNRIDTLRIRNDINHPSLDQLKVLRPDVPDIYEYEVFAFYREPVEKFMSFYAWNYMMFPLMNPCATVMEYVDKYGYFAHQTRWLKHDTVNIQLLDFANFESELRKVLAKIGIPLTTPIPKTNVSENQRRVSDLSAEEIAFIKNIYKKDYEFFDSKGITFNV